MNDYPRTIKENLTSLIDELGRVDTKRDMAFRADFDDPLGGGGSHSRAPLVTDDNDEGRKIRLKGMFWLSVITP